MALFAEASSSSSASSSATATIAKTELANVDLKGLKQEVQRAHARCFKKITKAHERLAKAEEEYKIVTEMEDPPLKRLESCPDPETHRKEIAVLQTQLVALQSLEEEVRKASSSSSDDLARIVALASSLGISDTPPPLPERGPKKAKGVAPPPRKPYKIFTSLDGIEIRVGRGASDNDELSCNPQHRDSADWWMHVSGCAGSHIVIRSHDDDLLSSKPETIRDAALLAVINSKAPTSGKVPVSVTRARHVSKPRGAKAGLVHLNGDVNIVNIDVKSEKQKRLARLERDSADHAAIGSGKAATDKGEGA